MTSVGSLSLDALSAPGSHNPADASPLPELVGSSAADVASAVAAARLVQPAWAATSLEARIERAMQLARRIVEKRA